MKIDPLKTLIRIVLLPERGLAFVDVIQMLHQPAQSIVFREIDKVPIEARVVIPFAPLAEFAAHEEQFLAGMAVHPRVKHSQVGELLPFVARHLRQQRTFAVHYYIVAQYQNEMFGERVEQRERDVAVMKTAKDRIETHVFKKVVHPTHVPFEPEPESAEINRSRNARPGG